MGIGVPDLGKSSYDPIATIRAGWEKSRQERMMNKELDQRNYEQYIKSMPTVEGINKKIASKYNKDLVQMGALFKQQQAAGGLAKMAKTPEGENVTAKLSELENKMATDIPIHNHYAEQYKKDLAVMRGANRDKIDWELTNQNVQRMNEAEDVTEFAQPFVDNAGTLVVYKPEPQDIIGYAKKVGSMVEGSDVMSHEIKVDPITNTMTTTQITGADPKKVHEAYRIGYEMAEPNMKNAIDSMYEVAPDKRNADGIVMDPKEWFANKFSGLHGTTTTKKTSRLPKDDQGEPTGLRGGIPRTDDGSIDLAAANQPIVMKSQTITPATYKTNWRGKKKEETPEMQQADEMEYEAYNIPLSGIDEVFDSITPADAIDTSTGAEPDRTKIGSHKAASISFMPTYNGSDNLPMEYEHVDKEGNRSTKKYTVRPGKPIPTQVLKAMINQGIPLTYEPYLLTKSVYGAAQEEKSMGTVSWSDYVSKHGKTIITPWASVNNAYLAKMGAEEYDLQEIKKYMAEMYGVLNQTP